MDKRQYVALLHTLETLPLPGTILYPPANKIDGNELLRYEIDKEGIIAVVRGRAPMIEMEITWTLKQVKQCTWKKSQ